MVDGFGFEDDEDFDGDFINFELASPTPPPEPGNRILENAT